MTNSTDVDQSIYPIFPEQAQQLFHERTDKLLRAAYLRTFTDEQEKRCLKKFIFFEKWWTTLDERQQERVKGVLAAECFYLLDRSSARLNIFKYNSTSCTH